MNDQKTTVLHIVEAAGGVERYLETLFNKMKQYPQYEHVLVCSQTYDITKFQDITKSIIVIDSMQNAVSLKSDLQSIKAVRKVIKRCKPSIVYCHSSKAGAIGRIADIGIKNKLIYNAHGWAFNMREISRKKIKFYELTEKILSSLADKIVCISEYEKESAIKHKICKKDKLVVINNGIDFDEFKNIHPKTREELDIPQNAFIIGTIGRLSKQKAPDIFVKMAAEVKKQIPEAFFLIVGDDIGDGQCRKETEDQIQAAGLQDNFLITGWVDDPLNYAALFDVATLFSRWEGFGLVLPEYMKLHKPIVASNSDAIPYVLGDAGLIIDINNNTEIVKQIVRLKTDTQLKELLIEKETERANMFNANKTAEEHRNLFLKYNVDSRGVIQ